jgi:hypothetical protein
LDKLKELVELTPHSILASCSGNDDGDIGGIITRHHYDALAPTICKSFFEKYIAEHANEEYYADRAKYIKKVDEKYTSLELYKYKAQKHPIHNEQAGLINRMVDLSATDGVWMYCPLVNRQQHIGYFGKNRPGGVIPGNTFEERLGNLREIITNADKMYALSKTKQYNDYKVFSPKLKDWDGTLELK